MHTRPVNLPLTRPSSLHRQSPYCAVLRCVSCAGSSTRNRADSLASPVRQFTLVRSSLRWTSSATADDGEAAKESDASDPVMMPYLLGQCLPDVNARTQHHGAMLLHQSDPSLHARTSTVISTPAGRSHQTEVSRGGHRRLRQDSLQGLFTLSVSRSASAATKEEITDDSFDS